MESRQYYVNRLDTSACFLERGSVGSKLASKSSTVIFDWILNTIRRMVWEHPRHFAVVQIRPAGLRI